MTRITTVSVVVLLSLPHVPGYSAETDEQGELEVIVVTGTRYQLPAKDVVGNTAIVDNGELELIGHTHIQESLARAAGVNLARGNGQEYLPAVRSPVLTGAGGCGNVLSAVDGIALRAAGFCNINELFEAHSELAQRIEVLRGPGTALFGSNAVHGIINVISAGVADEHQVMLGLEGGPHDYLRTNLSASHPQEKYGLRADVTLTHDGGYRDDSGFDQQKATVRHEYQAGDLAVTSTLAISNLNQETAGYVIGKDAYKDDDHKDTNPNPEAFRDAKSVRLANRIEYERSDDQRLVFTPYYRYTDMDFRLHFLPGSPLEQNGQHSAGLQSAYYWDLNDTLQVITGIDLEYTDAFLKQTQDQPTEGSAFLQATIPQGTQYDYQVDALMGAAFMQAMWQLSVDLSMTAGLRFEALNYQYDNQTLSGRTDENGVACDFGGCRYSRPKDGDNRFENWSPKLGLLYQLGNHQAYLNLASGFRAPQAAELYQLQRDQQVADLDSVKIASAELGVRGLIDRLTYELVVFAMRKRNEIYRDADFFNVSGGKTKHEGVELSLNYALTSDWYVAMAGSYALHKYRDDLSGAPGSLDGNDVDSAPRHFGSAQLGWQLKDNLRTELEWVHQSKYYTDPDNENSYEGHDLLNLRVNWQVAGAWRFSARLVNLTDIDYAERADFTSFSGDRYFTGEPRSLFIGVHGEW